MKHNKRCIEEEAATKEFQDRWPNFCHSCGAWGGVTYPVYVYRDGSADPGGSDPCSHCLEIGVCPRCGDQDLNFLERGGLTYGYCHKCGWDEHALMENLPGSGAMVCPEHICECYYDRANQEEVEIEIDYQPKKELEWNPDPVKFEDNQWWYYNEVWTDRVGPFGSEAEARTALAEYVKYLDGKEVENETASWE